MPPSLLGRPLRRAGRRRRIGAPRRERRWTEAPNPHRRAGQVSREGPRTARPSKGEIATPQERGRLPPISTNEEGHRDRRFLRRRPHAALRAEPGQFQAYTGRSSGKRAVQGGGSDWFSGSVGTAGAGRTPDRARLSAWLKPAPRAVDGGSLDPPERPASAGRSVLAANRSSSGDAPALESLVPGAVPRFALVHSRK
jgi:hypothetical protein